MTYRQRTLLRRCEKQLRRLSIPTPFDLDTFVADLAAQRGRPIEVTPMAPWMAQFRGLTGFWVGTDDEDHIYVDDRVPTLHRTHIVLHEVGHMLFGHEGAAVTTVLRACGINPRLVTHFQMRGGCGYREDQEREAETVASLIMGRTARYTEGGRSAASSEYGVPIGRIEELLGAGGLAF